MTGCCSKCGSYMIADTWCNHSSDSRLHSPYGQVYQHPPEQTELMHRKCTNCGYRWNELPNDIIPTGENWSQRFLHWLGKPKTAS